MSSARRPPAAEAGCRGCSPSAVATRSTRRSPAGFVQTRDRPADGGARRLRHDAPLAPAKAVRSRRAWTSRRGRAARARPDQWAAHRRGRVRSTASASRVEGLAERHRLRVGGRSRGPSTGLGCGPRPLGQAAVALTCIARGDRRRPHEGIPLRSPARSRDFWLEPAARGARARDYAADDGDARRPRQLFAPRRRAVGGRRDCCRQPELGSDPGAPGRPARVTERSTRARSPAPDRGSTSRRNGGHVTAADLAGLPRRELRTTRCGAATGEWERLGGAAAERRRDHGRPDAAPAGAARPARGWATTVARNSIALLVEAMQHAIHVRGRRSGPNRARSWCWPCSSAITSSPSSARCRRAARPRWGRFPTTSRRDDDAGDGRRPRAARIGLR